MPTHKLSANNHDNSISITLTEDNGQITYSGTYNGKMNRDDILALFAQGKKGLDGLNGKDGLPGRDGLIRGHDATQYSDATNGQPGQDGTNGTPGEDGKSGGPGGHIDIQMAKDDLDLLEVVGELNVQGGLGGEPGRHGIGGRGGRGAPGGAGCSWEEYDLTTVPHYDYHVHHDHDGHSYVHDVSHIDYIQTSVTRYKSSGHNGSDGANGLTPTTPLRRGRSGAPGKITYTIDGIQYNSPYQYKLNHVKFTDTHDESRKHFEYGESILSYYSLENRSRHMPSPNSNVLIKTTANQLNESDDGKVIGNLEPGQSNLSNQPARFTIAHPDSLDNPLQTINVNASAWCQRLQKPYKQEINSARLTVGYPIKLSELGFQSKAVRADEPFMFTSTVEFIPEFKQDGRVFEIRIEGADQAYTYRNVNQSSALTFSLEENQLIRTQPVTVNLYWQRIDTNEMSLIQQQRFNIQVTPTYKDAKHAYLLVINADTSPDKVQEWYAKLMELSNNSVNIWNTSYYGGFKLTQTNILSNIEQGTIVILDNLHAGTRSSHQLKQSDLLVATRDHDISIAAVDNWGPFAQPYADDSKVNVEGEPTQHRTIEHCIEELLYQNSTSHFHQIILPKERYYFSDKYKNNEENIAANLRKQLAKIFPNRCYSVCVSGQEQEQFKLNIHRLADPTHNKIRTLANSNIEDLIPVIPFTQKLKSVFSQTKNPHHMTLVNSIINDLLNEQKTLAQARTYGSWWDYLNGRYQHHFKNELVKLNQLITTIKDTKDFNMLQTCLPLLVVVIADIKYHVESQSSFWTRLINWFIPQVGEQLKADSLSLCAEALQTQVIKSSNELDCLVKFRQKLLALLQSNSTGFFGNKLSFEQRAAIGSLLGECADGNPGPYLKENAATWGACKVLNDLAAECKTLYPDYGSDFSHGR